LDIQFPFYCYFSLQLENAVGCLGIGN
jgi:hypothetical protein